MADTPVIPGWPFVHGTDTAKAHAEKTAASAKTEERSPGRFAIYNGSHRRLDLDVACGGRLLSCPVVAFAIEALDDKFRLISTYHPSPIVLALHGPLSSGPSPGAFSAEPWHYCQFVLFANHFLIQAGYQRKSANSRLQLPCLRVER